MPTAPAFPCAGSIVAELIRRRSKLEHDPEKWAPLFQKHHAQSRIQSAIALQPNPIALKPRVQPRAKMVTKAVQQLLGGFDGLHQFLCRCPVRR
jgi:hypothetical protein